MVIGERHKDIIRNIYIFCQLYKKHRDFTLYKNIARNNPLEYKDAEVLSSFCNTIVKTSKSTPLDFLKNKEDSINDAIDKYSDLKYELEYIKKMYGAKFKNNIYKSVKQFYRKKIFLYDMDSFFCHLSRGVFLYSEKVIKFEEFVSYYCFHTCLFTGKTKIIDTKKSLRIYIHLKNLLKQNGQ